MRLNGEGVYISGAMIDLIEAGEITPTESMLYFIINSRDYATDTNAELGKAIGCTATRTAKLVSSLCRKGFIQKTIKNGKRILRPCEIAP